jgi:hypothetical protein
MADNTWSLEDIKKAVLNFTRFFVTEPGIENKHISGDKRLSSVVERSLDGQGDFICFNESYNNYPLGLAGSTPPYVATVLGQSAQSGVDAIESYQFKRLWYLSGDHDACNPALAPFRSPACVAHIQEEEAEALADKECVSNLQGPWRPDRARYFMDHLHAIYGPMLQHRFVSVPNVGHNPLAAWASLEGMGAIIEALPPEAVAEGNVSSRWGFVFPVPANVIDGEQDKLLPTSFWPPTKHRWYDQWWLG